MALASTVGAVTTIGGAAGLPGADKVGNVAEDTIGTVGDLFGGGETKKAVPDRVPQSPQGPVIGTLHNGPPGAPDYSQTAQLRVGLHAYDFLNSAGLHDAISHLELTEPGYEVFLYSGVEGGEPAGTKMGPIQTPATITIDQLRAQGLENQISSIAVRPAGEPSGSGGTSTQDPTQSQRSQPSGGSQNGGTTSGGNGAAGGIAGMLRSSLANPITLVVLALGLGAWFYDG